MSAQEAEVSLIDALQPCLSMLYKSDNNSERKPAKLCDALQLYRTARDADLLSLTSKHTTWCHVYTVRSK